MIPLRIKLRNFLSYGGHVQTINFEPYRLICLSGKNGHGKSALLDAITWALWGQARKTITTSKADEGLIRLGQTHMMVTFDFIANKQQYRVQREFVINNGKSHTELHFGTLNQHGLFNALNEKTTRATQQKIIDTIGLDYECCINSIFLRQGQSNEFSSKSAKERKEILSTILGINHYEMVRSHALERMKEEETAQAQFSHIIHHLKERVIKKTIFTQQLQELEKKIFQLFQDEELLQKQRDQHVQKSSYLQEQAHKKIRVEQECEYVQKNFLAARDQLLKERSSVRSLRTQMRIITPLLSEQQREILQRELLTLEEQQKELYSAQESLLKLHSSHANLVQEITADYHKELAGKTTAQQASEIHVKNITKNIEEQAALIIKKQEACMLYEKELKALGCTVEALERDIALQEKTIERKKQFYHTWISRANTITQTIKELEQKKILACSDQSPTCPLCEQSLSEKKKQALHKKFEQEERIKIHQKKRFCKLIPTLKDNLIELHARLVHGQKIRTNLHDLLTQRDLVKKELDELQKLHAQTQAQQQKISESLKTAQHDVTLFEQNKQSFFSGYASYQQSQKEIETIEKRKAACSYHEQRHRELTEMFQLMQQQEKIYALQDQYQRDYELHKQNFYQACSQARACKNQLQEIRSVLTTFAHLAHEFDVQTQEEKRITEQQHHITKLKIDLLQEKSGVEQNIKLIEHHEHELSEYAKKIEHHQTERDDYTLIAQALSKNGIQALLIETAIPELEFETNNILSKLTDNQSHVIIESVRDLKSGGFKETLDIKISDAVGTRPYELFSGGEAFRIDFALRIALSKLLARRSGTSLQTLIIDEGFGSQDEEGLSRIMEALYKIQDDFAKIIIVSHLTEMKNQFPTHFFVHKSPAGSQITIFEQG